MVDTISLAQVKPGTRVKIVDMTEGKIRNGRLLDMGITPGTEVFVAAVHPFHGPVVVDLAGVKIAIGRRIARNIAVASKGNE